MKKPKIQLVLTDDWELRGNGSGNMQTIQFDTIRNLCKIYDIYGIKGTFYAEIMQQLYQIKYGREYPELMALATEWDETIKEVYSKGHDVQLHIHPQWQKATFNDGIWNLPNDWSILNYESDVATKLISDCKKYLEKLLKSVNSSYRCISFRSGNWCFAPSDFIQKALSENGIKIDVSIVNGYFRDSDRVKVDYRNCEESFLPYHPDIFDARNVGQNSTIIECPTHSFRANFFDKILAKAIDQIPNSTAAYNANCIEEKCLIYKRSFINRIIHFLRPDWHVSDLSNLSFPFMMKMIRDIRRRTRLSGWDVVPIVITNHTKDIVDFEPIGRFCKFISRQKDIETVTISQLFENIKNKMYSPVLKK